MAADLTKRMDELMVLLRTVTEDDVRKCTSLMEILQHRLQHLRAIHAVKRSVVEYNTIKDIISCYLSSARCPPLLCGNFGCHQSCHNDCFLETSHS